MEQNEMMLKIVLDNWNAALKRTDDLINGLSDEQLGREVSPGRNRGTYLLGHLAAVHDAMLPLLGIGASHYPELLDRFIKNPDDKKEHMQTTAQLRQYWKDINASLSDKFTGMTASDWLQRHTSVSPEAFEKEPHRNRLNVLVSRSLHLAGHYNQMVFLKGKDE